MNRVTAVLAAIAVSGLAACGSQSPAPVVSGTTALEPAADGAPPLPAAKPGTTVGGSVIVEAGDTVYAIARRSGVSVRGLIERNGLAPPYILSIGQTLSLPEERLYDVVPGDTLTAIARRFGVSMRSLAQLNGLAEPYIVKIGQRLKIPLAGIAVTQPAVAQVAVAEAGVTQAPTESAPAAPSAIEATPAPPPEPIASEEAVPVPEPDPLPAVAPEPALEPALQPATITAAVPQPAPLSEGKFAWPVQGKVISTFGPKPEGLNNDGINIAAPRGAPVLAAENGVVVYAGNEIPGFGNLVLLRHADGWATAYAHNETLLVEKGDRVARGQQIARVGATGSVSEPQSHFEIRKGNEPVDPVPYLAVN